MDLDGGVIHNEGPPLQTPREMDFPQCCGTVTIFYGSGSDFWKVMVPVPTFDKVMVPVPVPTFEKFQFRFRLQLHIYTIKSKLFLKNLFPFNIVLFYKEKDYKYQQIYCKMWKKKC